MNKWDTNYKIIYSMAIDSESVWLWVLAFAPLFPIHVGPAEASSVLSLSQWCSRIDNPIRSERDIRLVWLVFDLNVARCANENGDN